MAESEEFYAKRFDIERSYRSSSVGDLLKYRVVIGESDLWVLSKNDLRIEIQRLLKFYRRQLKGYIDSHPGFLETLTPLPDDNQAPLLIRSMLRASNLAGVGPMAAVAGAIAAAVGSGFPAEEVSELIIENGGDIYLRSHTERVVAVFAGPDSPFSGKLGILIPPQPEGIGICTSSGKFGPSFSFGKADAVMTISSDPSVADAAATAGANRVQTGADLPQAISFLQNIPGISGALIIKADQIAVWGNVELIPLSNKSI